MADRYKKRSSNNFKLLVICSCYYDSRPFPSDHPSDERSALRAPLLALEQLELRFRIHGHVGIAVFFQQRQFGLYRFSPKHPLEAGLGVVHYFHQFFDQPTPKAELLSSTSPPYVRARGSPLLVKGNGRPAHGHLQD